MPGWQTLASLAMAWGFAAGLVRSCAEPELTAMPKVSTIAPFEYTSIVLGILIGYLYYGECFPLDHAHWHHQSWWEPAFLSFYVRFFSRLRAQSQRKLVTPQGLTQSFSYQDAVSCRFLIVMLAQPDRSVDSSSADCGVQSGIAPSRGSQTASLLAPVHVRLMRQRRCPA